MHLIRPTICLKHALIVHIARSPHHLVGQVGQCGAFPLEGESMSHHVQMVGRLACYAIEASTTAPVWQNDGGIATLGGRRCESKWKWLEMCTRPSADTVERAKAVLSNDATHCGVTSLGTRHYGLVGCQSADITSTLQ
jgi:hypothetical protein